MSESSGKDSPPASVTPIDRYQKERDAKTQAMQVARAVQERNLPKKPSVVWETWKKLQETHFPRNVLTVVGAIATVTEGPGVVKHIVDSLQNTDAQVKFIEKLQNQLTPGSQVVIIDGQVIIRPPAETSVNVRNAPFTQPTDESDQSLGKIVGKINPGQSMILEDAVLVEGQSTSEPLAGTQSDTNNTWLMFPEDTNEDGIGDKLRFIALTDQTKKAVFVDPEAKEKKVNVVSADLKHAALTLQNDKGVTFQPVGYRASFEPKVSTPPQTITPSK